MKGFIRLLLCVLSLAVVFGCSQGQDVVASRRRMPGTRAPTDGAATPALTGKPAVVEEVDTQEASPVFEPFTDVVFRAEAEAARILERRWVKVRVAKDLDPYSCGSSPSEEWSRDYRAQTSGGKVLWIDPVKRRADMPPLARLLFQVPEEGKYLLFLKGDTWCCPGAIAFAIDDGAAEVVEGSWGIGEWCWQSLKSRSVRIGSNDGFSLPVPYDLTAGSHKLDVFYTTASCSGLFMDELAVVRKAAGRQNVLLGRKEQVNRFLDAATKAGNVEAVGILLDHGANPDGSGKALAIAENCRRKEVGRLLVQRGATTEFPLHAAAWTGDTNMVAVLLDANPGAMNGTWKGRYGGCAVHLAARHGNGDVVRLLLGRGADIGKKTAFNGWTPLHIALQEGQPDVARLLVVAGADVSARDKAQSTPLHWAKNKEIVQFLVERGADVNATNKWGDTPLHRAQAGDTQLLLKHGADVKAANRRGNTPLHGAQKNKASGLLRHGANPNARGEHRRTPLHVTADWGTRDVAEVLLAHAADVNAVDGFDETPLHIAAFKGKSEVAKALLDHGADKDAGAGKAGTPLMSASINGCEAVVKLLIQAGADVNAPDEEGMTPLYWAVRGNRRKIVKLLMEQGADPAAQGLNGNMPPRLTERAPSRAEAFRRFVESSDERERDVNED